MQDATQMSTRSAADFCKVFSANKSHPIEPLHLVLQWAAVRMREASIETLVPTKIKIPSGWCALSKRHILILLWWIFSSLKAIDQRPFSQKRQPLHWSTSNVHAFSTKSMDSCNALVSASGDVASRKLGTLGWNPPKCLLCSWKTAQQGLQVVDARFKTTSNEENCQKCDANHRKNTICIKRKARPSPF